MKSKNKTVKAKPRAIPRKPNGGGKDVARFKVAQLLKRVRPELQMFALAMEVRLQQHDPQKGDSWRSMSIEGIMAKLREEAAELFEALATKGPEAILYEAVDLATVCMMLAHIAGPRGLEAAAKGVRDPVDIEKATPPDTAAVMAQLVEALRPFGAMGSGETPRSADLQRAEDLVTAYDEGIAQGLQRAREAEERMVYLDLTKGAEPAGEAFKEEWTGEDVKANLDRMLRERATPLEKDAEPAPEVEADG